MLDLGGQSGVRIISLRSFLQILLFVESNVHLMDDQLINKRIDRISMKGGPNGSAKPI